MSHAVSRRKFLTALVAIPAGVALFPSVEIGRAHV